MQITTGGTNGENIIGQRYKVISTATQNPYSQTSASGTPSLKIQVSIESSTSGEWSDQFNHNRVLLVKCLTLLNILFATSPEGLQEASEALETMVEYYNVCKYDWLQNNLPQELGVIKGTISSSEVRRPLVLDLD
ncbi:hypothetical protein [Nostoc sp.]|uniref:hypothetical protein n=1 Tax=Nostoc sp. TaxID=1180 RepID=UPI002FFD50B0